MAQKYLATYLNDHLAGSVTLLEILDHLSSAYAGTEIQQFAVELRAEVTADRQELERVMATLQIAHSSARKASAWIASKMSELKLHVDDMRDKGLRLLETMELVSVGIEGKHCSGFLWPPQPSACPSCESPIISA